MPLATRLKITYIDIVKNTLSVEPDVFDRPAAERYVAIHLTTSLPSPANDCPEARARRDRTAAATIASLHPANEAEALLAAQFLTADAQAGECLRLANLPGTDRATALKCTAQAGTMMRQSQAALRALPRMQSMREMPDADRAETASAVVVPQKPKPNLTVRPAPVATRSDLPGLPRGPLAGRQLADCVLDDIIHAAVAGRLPLARLNPTTRDVETMVRRAADRAVSLEADKARLVG